jgi:hypothetical protein
MLKLRFTCNWDTDINLSTRIIDNYGVNDDIEFITTDKDYDYLIVFNRLTDFSKFKNKNSTISFIMEPTWNIGDANDEIDKNLCNYSRFVFVHNKKCFDNAKEVVEHPTTYMFFHDPINRDFFININFKKKKKMSFIISNKCVGNGTGNVQNYSVRLDVLKKILKSDLNVDIFGRSHNINDVRYKGELEYGKKYNGLIDYEFSIALENCSEIGYITEKFVDPVLCDTIPIYYGAPNIDVFYNNKGFIKLNTIDDPISQLRKIIEFENYNNYFPYNCENKKKYFTDYNLLKLLYDVLTKI